MEYDSEEVVRYLERKMNERLEFMSKVKLMDVYQDEESNSQLKRIPKELFKKLIREYL